MNKLSASVVAAFVFACGTSLSAGAPQTLDTSMFTPVTTEQAPVDHVHLMIERKTKLHGMKRDACFKMAGIKGKDFGGRVSKTVQEMKLALETLRAEIQAGNPVAGVASQLDELDSHWGTLAAALQQVSAGDFHAVPLRQVMTLEPEVHLLLKDIHSIFIAGGSETQTDVQKATSEILLQKMRVQKVTKEACLVLRGISAETNLASLEMTEDAFTTALNAALSQAQGAERAQLEAIKMTWNDFSTLLDNLKSQAYVADDAKLRLSVLSDDLTAQITAMEQF
ncbi:hypothetical protein [Roseobacter weihaiensis]|uniref:hypothetical protein n=1 Tax=Roseobacter weihaiensis TaxID=2763262 RepID=UPI001D09DBAB|nr:hypothetical protein [Roseobacter sp. H9]